MKILSLLMLLITTSACSSTNPIALERLHSSAQCGDEKRSMQFIDAAKLHRLKSGQNPLKHTWQAQPSAPANTEGKQFLMISLGQKPTGGYGLALTAEKAAVERGVLWLPVQLDEPQPGTMQTQQITQPCLVIGLAPGGYHEVRIRELPGLVAQVTQP